MKALALILILVFGTILGTNASACSEDGSSGFLPENDLRIPVGAKSQGSMTEVQFESVINKVEKIYSPVVANMDAKLVIKRLWTHPKVNAVAYRQEKDVWTVEMYGALARHPSITRDGFALVLCHELGHHIGGAPKYRSLAKPWASSEGQSDYFATLKCLRRVFLNDNNDAIVKKLSPPSALVSACNKAHNKEDALICIRSGMAGASVAALFSSLGSSKLASFNTPDETVVKANSDEHPATQCRLDTFFQGSICEVAFNEDVSQKDEVKGTCHAANGHKTGLRPRCWHKPVTR